MLSRLGDGSHDSVDMPKACHVAQESLGEASPHWWGLGLIADSPPERTPAARRPKRSQEAGSQWVRARRRADPDWVRSGPRAHRAAIPRRHKGPSRRQHVLRYGRWSLRKLSPCASSEPERGESRLPQK